jgi:hypothetical protein
VKVAVLDPAATVTLAGTKATVPVVHSSTDVPPAGAAAVSVTVPVDDVPVVTLAGLTETDERATVAAGVRVSAAVLLTLL